WFCPPGGRDIVIMPARARAAPPPPAALWLARADGGARGGAVLPAAGGGGGPPGGGGPAGGRGGAGAGRGSVGRAKRQAACVVRATGLPQIQCGGKSAHRGGDRREGLASSMAECRQVAASDTSHAASRRGSGAWRRRGGQGLAPRGVSYQR